MREVDRYVIKRKALGMTQEQFALIANVPTSVMKRYEAYQMIPPTYHRNIEVNIENYIRSLDRSRYLQTRILEETMLMQIEPEKDHLKTLSHMMIHVSKLNMMYVNKEVDPQYLKDKEWR